MAVELIENVSVKIYHIACPFHALLHEVLDELMTEKYSLYRNVAAVIGGLVLAKVSFKFLRGVYRWTRAYFLAPWGIGRTNLKKYGSWAVVTGASAGIGRGYALELARQGLNVVIMSRSQEKLDKVAEEIREKYGREVCVVPADFSRGPEIYPQIEESVQDLDIGVLVNNVGISAIPDMFLDTSIEEMRKTVEVNNQALIHMIHMIMPRMVTKGRGIVVNVSSVAASSNVMMIVHAATKTFTSFFTKSLANEYASKGIIVQDVAPLGVATEKDKLSANWMIPDPVQYTRSAVATIGILPYTNGCLSHAIQSMVFSSLPDFVFIRLMWSMMRGVQANRRKLRSEQA